MRWSLVFVLLFAGCATPGICDYDLAGNGWYPVAAPLPELHYERREGTQWFKNDKGDFFACYQLKRGGLCGNAYTLYKKAENGSYKPEEIVCTR